jgi:hypothetical protein
MLTLNQGDRSKVTRFLDGGWRTTVPCVYVGRILARAEGAHIEPHFRDNFCRPLLNSSSGFLRSYWFSESPPFDQQESYSDLGKSEPLTSLNHGSPG